MVFVLDTNSFSVLKNYYPSSFSTLWGRLDALAEDGTVVSVREVFNELQKDNRAAFVQDWAKQHKEIFAKPDDAELAAVQQILAIPHFQAVISRRAILKGTPVADPFIVASGLVKGATVITEEATTPNAAKIPNICGHFGVRCHNLEWFMEQQAWSF